MTSKRYFESVTAHTPECNAANDRSPVEICTCPGGPDADEPGYYGTANDSEIGPEVYPDASAPLAPRDTECAGCGASQQTRYYDLHGKRTPFCSRCSVGLEHSPWTPRPARAARRYACAFLLSFLSLPVFGAEPCKVNVNAATPAQIQLLARTGEVLAGRIVAGRPLDAEKLDAVKGVGPAWLAVNGPHVAFSGPTTCTEKIRAPKVAAQFPKL